MGGQAPPPLRLATDYYVLHPEHIHSILPGMGLIGYYGLLGLPMARGQWSEAGMYRLHYEAQTLKAV